MREKKRKLNLNLSAQQQRKPLSGNRNCDRYIELPGVPGIVTFISKNIEPLIFLSVFGSVCISYPLIFLLKLSLELEIKVWARIIASLTDAHSRAFAFNVGHDP